MDLKFNMEKLKGTQDWRRWKRQIELVLKHHGVVDIVTGKRTCPDNPEEGANKEECEKAAQAIRAYEKEDSLAQVLIVSALDDSHIELTATCENAHVIWQKLMSVYEQSSSQRLDRTLEQFFTSSIGEGEDLVRYISRLQLTFREVNEELQMHKASVLPDIVLMSRIMSTLPNEFFEFKSVWESIPVADRSVDLLIERIRLIESRLPGKNMSGQALHVKKNTSEKSSSYKEKKSFKKVVKCFVCKGPHYASKCPQKAESKGKDKQEKGRRADEQFLCYVANGQSQDKFIADSGASQHMCHSKRFFHTYEEFPTPISVTVGNNEVIQAIGEGSVRVDVRIGQRNSIRFLEKVWYVPKLGRNLMSVSRTVQKGYTFKANKNKCVFLKDNVAQLFGHSVNGLYELEMEVMLPQDSHGEAEAAYGSKGKTIQEWHESLAHQNKAYVLKFLRDKGIAVKNEEEFCEGCVLGKQHRDTYRTQTVKPTTPGEIISGDLCGPMENLSLGGNRYCMVFKDYFTKFRRVFFIKNKSEVADCLETFLNECKTTGHVVKCFMSDCGTEIVNATTKKMLTDRGITIRTVMPYTPEENGSIEREMRTLVESARSMLYSKDLPKCLWAEAMNTACHVINRTGPTSEGRTPYELWYNKGAAPIEHFRPFGEDCYVHVPKQKRKKWSAKSFQGKLVGYCGERDGFRVYDGHKVVVSRDVVFKPYRNTGSVKAEGMNDSEDENLINEDKESEESVLLPIFNDQTGDANGTLDNTSAKDSQCNTGDTCKDDGNRGHRQRKAPAYLQDYVLLSEAGPTYGEAVRSNDWWHWQAAMKEEMASLQENEVYEVVPLPKHKKALGVKWVLNLKKNPERYKARLVAKGYTQEHGVDYNETFSPVARFDTIRCTLNVVAQENLHLKQFDVKTAFLYSKLDEEIYVKQPEGYDDSTGRVWKLKRSLYGLKQSPRCWNQKVIECMLEQGLQQSAADPCLFIRNRNGKKLIVVIYVDDGLIAGSDAQEVAELITQLENKFQLKVTDPDCYLGIEINRKGNVISLDQKSYILSVLNRYRMSDSNPVGTPITPKRKEALKESKPLGDEVPYRQAVGSLLYITNTRPDISYAVNMVAKKINSPTTEDWNAVKRIMRYLKGTLDYALNYKKGENILHCYSDSDYAGDEETRKSRTGFLCMFAGGPVSWGSLKQDCVTLSTTEAEFVAASEAAKQIVWLKRLFEEIYECQMEAVLYVDNAGAVRLAKNAGDFHKRSKHIHVRYNYVREEFNKARLMLNKSLEKINWQIS